MSPMVRLKHFLSYPRSEGAGRAGESPRLWLVLGASSAMARPFMRLAAEAGDALWLCGRDATELDRSAADARLRGAALAQAKEFDCRAPEGFAPLIAQAEALAAAQSLKICVAVFTGSMPEQAEIDSDPALIDAVMQDGYLGPARFLQLIAPKLEAQGGGIVVGVSSVAGERGRLPNYVYGASKAAFTTYLSGLRNRLGRSGVHVLTVKPGLVDTGMIWGLKRAGKGAAPEMVARDIWRAALRRRNVLYTPRRWRLIMAVIRALPEPIFKRMKL